MSNNEYGQQHPAYGALSGENEEDMLSKSTEVLDDKNRLIAFYLPQYHRVAENSEWWSPGFTEWTNVARAKPNYVGHVQPKIPRELGFYDLTHPDTMGEQVSMAKSYGVSAFCFYYYWFSGRRLLEKPLDQFLNSKIDFNFTICWANENWTRTWDGDTKHVLLQQLYRDSDADAFIEAVAPILRDPRYIRVNGLPLLLVYRAKEIPNPKAWFAQWRKRALELGLPGLHISCVDFYDISTPEEVNADSLVEFPPHKFIGPENHPDVFPGLLNQEFKGGMVDYRKVARQSINKPAPSFPYFRGIIPSWDNTARRQDTSLMMLNADPAAFRDWLAFLRAETRDRGGEQIIFINAWNEWAEGCCLEPDMANGLKYLEAVLETATYGAADTAGTLRQAVLEKLEASLAASRAHASSAGGAQGADAEAPAVLTPPIFTYVPPSRPNLFKKATDAVTRLVARVFSGGNRDA